MPIFRGSKDATVSSGDIVATQADIAEALTSAQQAQAASEAAQAAAEAALDNFDDRYLGAKSSDPTVDNDGDPLIDGALYYNTTDNVTKIYDLGNDKWVNLRLSDAEQANVDTVAGIADDVTTVAGVSTDVTTVAGISSDVSTVATNVSDITNFADVYLGPAASDPSVRNDGSALQAGDLYFNTTDDRLKVYDGSAWEVTARLDSEIRALFSAGGDLTYNSSTGVFSFTERTDAEVRGLFSAAGDLSYNSTTGEFSFTERTDSEVRNLFSASGDLSYDSGTGTFSVTTYKSTDFDTDFGSKTTDDLSEGTTNLYYADSLVDSHLTGGTGVTYSSGTISIGQDVGTSAAVQFATVNTGQGDNELYAMNQDVQTTDSVTFVDAEFTGTGAVELPEGTEAQRPGTPAAGMIRFNSDVSSFEGYDGSSWGALGGEVSLSFPFFNDTTTADNIPLLSNNLLPFFRADGSQDNITVVT